MFKPLLQQNTNDFYLAAHRNLLLTIAVHKIHAPKWASATVFGYTQIYYLTDFLILSNSKEITPSLNKFPVSLKICLA